MPSFLDAEALLGGEFLHPGGEQATRFILEFLALRPAQTVVDLGCGTGATAKAIVDEFDVQVIALDRSTRMLARARRRLAPEIRQRKVRLVRADLSEPLPIPDGNVDAVYSESVLALTDPAPPLHECFRILCPGGRIATNDRIWKPRVGADEAARINAISRSAFGIPAATPQPLDRDGWLALYRQAGFVDVQAISVDELAAVDAPDGNRSSRLTDLKPDLKRYARYAGRPRLVWQHVRFRREIRQHRTDWDRLESYIFLARKPD